jgi:hypothetical protein
VITNVTASPAGSSCTLIQTFTTASEPSVIPSLFPFVDSFDASARPVTMNTTFESTSEQTEQSTQELPTIPIVAKMKHWDEEKVVRWIQQKEPNLLIEDDVNNFKKARIGGRAFLNYGVENFESSGLPLAVAVALKDLADEVKKGKFIPRT